MSDGIIQVTFDEFRQQWTTVEGEDKLRGACLIEAIDPRDKLLLCTGRISSEMINKAARMGCPIVASRAAPNAHRQNGCSTHAAGMARQCPLQSACPFCEAVR